MSKKLINEKKNIVLSNISYTEKKFGPGSTIPGGGYDDPGPLFLEADPRIWIHYSRRRIRFNMKWIRNRLQPYTLGKKI